jgi:transcriptional regulator with XRE-family HTH domain
MDAEIGKKIGKRLRDLREERGLRQEDLAQRANMNFNTISRIENGYHLPSATSMVHLASALEVGPGELFPKERAPTSSGLIEDLKNLAEAESFGEHLVESRPQTRGEGETVSTGGDAGIESAEAFGRPTVERRVESLFENFRRGDLTLNQLQSEVIELVQRSA